MLAREGNQHAIEVDGIVLGRMVLGAQSKLTIMPIEGHCLDTNRRTLFGYQSKDIVELPIERHFAKIQKFTISLNNCL